MRPRGAPEQEQRVRPPVPKRPLALLGGVSSLPDGRELPAWLRWLLSSAVAWLGPPAAGAALLPAAGSAFPSPRVSLLSAGALSFGVWGNPGGAEAFSTRFVAFRGSSRLGAGPYGSAAAAGADKSGSRARLRRGELWCHYP